MHAEHVEGYGLSVTTSRAGGAEVNVDPEIKRKAEDLKRPSGEDPRKRNANKERRHLDEKADEIIDEAAKEKSQKDASIRRNLTIRYYPSGHMIYLDGGSRTALKADLAQMYDSAVADRSAMARILSLQQARR